MTAKLSGRTVRDVLEELRKNPRCTVASGKSAPNSKETYPILILTRDPEPLELFGEEVTISELEYFLIDSISEIEWSPSNVWIHLTSQSVKTRSS